MLRLLTVNIFFAAIFSKKSARSKNSRTGDSAQESDKVGTKEAAVAHQSHNDKVGTKEAAVAHQSHNANQPPLDNVQRKKSNKPDIFLTKELPKKTQKKREYVPANHPDYQSLKQLDMDIFTKKKLEQKQAKPRDFPSQVSLTESKL